MAGLDGFFGDGGEISPQTDCRGCPYSHHHSHRRASFFSRRASFFSLYKTFVLTPCTLQLSLLPPILLNLCVGRATLWQDANLCASINRFFSVLMLTTTATASTDIPGGTRSHLLHQEHHAHSALSSSSSSTCSSFPLFISSSSANLCNSQHEVNWFPTPYCS